MSLPDARQQPQYFAHSPASQPGGNQGIFLRITRMTGPCRLGFKPEVNG